MRYFDTNLIANSRPHAAWWEELCVNRQHFHNSEEHFAALNNSTAVLPRDAWMEMDETTRRVMRDDEGQAYMQDLMALAKPVHIGKLVHLNRVSSDAGTVHRSVSGQVPISLDKVVYDYRGTPVPMFATGYGREWREWNTLQSVNFDALQDDQEAHSAKIKRDQAIYALDGDPEIAIGGYPAYGIRTHPMTKKIDLGAGGVNIDLTDPATTSDEVDAFFTQIVGKLFDDNLIAGKANFYVSPEIARRMDLTYSGSAGTKEGKLRDFMLTNRRIGKIETTFELEGNEFFAFVPNAQYIRPLVGMALNTTARVRLNPTDNYQFAIMGALGIDIRTDYNGKGGVFHAVELT